MTDLNDARMAKFTLSIKHIKTIVIVYSLLAAFATTAEPIVFNSEEEFIEAVAKAQKVIREREIKALFGKAEAEYVALSGDKKDRLIYGKTNSRYVVTEYSDIECPACRYYYPYTKQLVDKYPEEVALEFKHFPLEFHGAKAIEEAKSAICAGQLHSSTAEFAVIDVLFAKTRSNGDGTEFTPSDIAKAFDIKPDAFNQCLLSSRTDALLQESIDVGFKAKIEGTPTLIFIDTKTGKTLMTGGGDLKFLEEQFKQLKE